MVAAASAGLPDQCLQRLHRRTRAHALPKLASIKDLGGLFRSPWQQKFFTLLGEKRSLDDVEHGLIRAPGAFDEPRIHVAVVCASIGCPMLRPDAYTAEQLESELEVGMQRFLSDRRRNHFDVATGRLSISRIFDRTMTN